MPTLFVLDVPEYAPLVAYAEGDEALSVTRNGHYAEIRSLNEIAIPRGATGLEPAIWFGAVVGGLDGRIVEFSEERLVIAD